MARGHDACVLLLSHRQEPFCTARVAGALAARGARVVRLDTDGFPAAVSLSGELGGAEADALVLAGERVAVEADWKWRIGLLGKQVVVSRTDGTSVTGRLREMGFDAIQLDLPDETVYSFVPESVEHVREDR